MKRKSLIAIAVTAAFALPFAAQAAGDKAATGATSAAKDDGGAEAMFKALDKNKDGFISREEAKGTPHDKDFATLDKNKDGKLSREEHAAAPEHAGGRAGSAGATGAKPAPSGSAPGGASGAKGSKY